MCLCLENIDSESDTNFLNFKGKILIPAHFLHLLPDGFQTFQSPVSCLTLGLGGSEVPLQMTRTVLNPLSFPIPPFPKPIISSGSRGKQYKLHDVRLLQSQAGWCTPVTLERADGGAMD